MYKRSEYQKSRTLYQLVNEKKIHQHIIATLSFMLIPPSGYATVNESILSQQYIAQILNCYVRY